MWNDSVVGACKTCDAIEKNYDISFRLNQTLRFLKNHIRNLYVTLRRIIERGADYFGVYRSLHISNLFRPLVDQENDELYFRMIPRDAVRNFLKQDCLAGLW